MHCTGMHGDALRTLQSLRDCYSSAFCVTAATAGKTAHFCFVIPGRAFCALVGRQRSILFCRSTKKIVLGQDGWFESVIIKQSRLHDLDVAGWPGGSQEEVTYRLTRSSLCQEASSFKSFSGGKVELSNRINVLPASPLKHHQRI